MTGWIRQKIWRERKVIGDVAGSEVGNGLGFICNYSLHHPGWGDQCALFYI